MWDRKILTSSRRILLDLKWEPIEVTDVRPELATAEIIIITRRYNPHNMNFEESMTEHYYVIRALQFFFLAGKREGTDGVLKIDLW